MKVLYIFAGSDREELEKKIAEKTAPDTAFFGYNHLKNDSRIQANYLQLRKSTYRFSFFRRNPFLSTLYLLLTHYKKIGDYDVILLASSAYINLLFLKKLGFFRKQRWFIFNIDLTIQSQKKEKNRLSDWIFQTNLHEAHKILCLSNAQKDYLLKRGLPEHKLVFLPLGIDVDFYKLLPAGNSFVLAIGRDEGRDYKTLLEAARLVPETKFVIICARKNLEKIQDGVPSNVEVFYDLFNLEVRPYYEGARAFLIPTKPSYFLIGSDCGGQTSVLDSMAYGRPVIITKHPWIYDYFQEGEHILTVPPQDPKALAIAVRRICTDDELSAKLIRNAKKLVDEQYNSLAMARKIGDLILTS